MAKNYSTRIVSIGDQVNELEREKGMIVVFDESVEDSLRDVSVIHTRAQLPQEVKVGDYVAFGNRSYKITAVGREANTTLKSLGHCAFVFNGAPEVLLPHQINLDNKLPLPILQVGDLFEIIFS